MKTTKLYKCWESWTPYLKPRSKFISGTNAVSPSVFLPTDIWMLLLSPGLAYNSLSLQKLLQTCIVPLQRKAKIRAPGTWPSYLSESRCDYVQKSHFNGQVSPTPHFVCLWGNFSNLSELKLNIFDPCVQGYKFGYSHIRELKWDDSWRSGLQFWHCSRYVPTAVT